MNHIPCNNCGADRPELLCETPAGRRIHRCGACGFVYVTPVPGEGELLETHEHGCYEIYGKGYETLLERKRTEWRLLFDELANFTPRGELLEVGCAKGYCGVMAREAGWRHTGVDIAKDDVEFARREFGLNTVHGTLQQAAFDDNRFDAAVMWSVIEHLSDPSGALAETLRVLRPGGVLSVATCNVESRAAREAGPDWKYFQFSGHLCFFSPATLSAMLKSVGFEIIRVTSGMDLGSDTLNAAKNAVKNILGRVLPPAAVNRIRGLASRSLKADTDAANEVFLIYARKPL